jgi:hypothetical protein
MDCDTTRSERGPLRDERANARDDRRGEHAERDAFFCAVVGLDWPGTNTSFVPSRTAIRFD